MIPLTRFSLLLLCSSVVLAGPSTRLRAVIASAAIDPGSTRAAIQGVAEPPPGGNAGAVSRSEDHRFPRSQTELGAFAGSLLLIAGGLCWRTRMLARRNPGPGALIEQLQQAKDEERKHLARELHDEFGQALTAVKLNLAIAKADQDCDRLSDSISEVDRLISQVRALSISLRPTQVDQHGLVPALENHLRAVARHSGVEIVFTAPASLPSLGPERDIVIFRVAQEAVTNALRHADAKRIEVRLEAQERGSRLEVRDDGRGFDAEAALRENGAGHLGLYGMNERVRDLGGRFELRSQPGAGTTITAELRGSLANSTEERDARAARG